MKRYPGRAGFTLVELLVASVIFSIVIGASWALLSSGHDVSRRAAHEAARFQSARTALRAIEGDLRGAFIGNSSYDTGMIGINAGTAGDPRDSITLVSFAYQPGAASPSAGIPERESDLIRISYSIDDDARTSQTGLVRERRKRISEIVTVVEPGANLEEIARDVVGLDLRYYDGGSWLDAWDSTLSGTLPAAIEASLRVRGSSDKRTELETFTTRIYLPVGATAPGKQP